jgi:hypothetical protein
LNIKDRFTETYDGLPSIRFGSSSEYHNFEWQLKFANVSFRSKIIKTKKYGREFIVMLLEEQPPVATQEIISVNEDE